MASALPRRGTSLYRCEGCGSVVRYWAGKTSLKHLHQGNYEGEFRFVEFEDDGRELPDDDDLRSGEWTA